MIRPDDAFLRAGTRARIEARRNACPTICTSRSFGRPAAGRRTLRKFIEATNGELVIAARFADGFEISIRLAERDDAM